MALSRTKNVKKEAWAGFLISALCTIGAAGTNYLKEDRKQTRNGLLLGAAAAALFALWHTPAGGYVRHSVGSLGLFGKSGGDKAIASDALSDAAKNVAADRKPNV